MTGVTGRQIHSPAHTIDPFPEGVVHMAVPAPDTTPKSDAELALPRELEILVR